ncbi:MAG: hypothetical protein NVSMB51_12880 [Solirubrobacteraceae bacterium]
MISVWPPTKPRTAAILSRAPVLAFTVTFMLSCWLGVALLLLGPDWIRETYVYLSGADLGVIDGAALLRIAVLLNLCPLLLLGGWRLGGRRKGSSNGSEQTAYAAWRLTRIVATLAVLAVYLSVKLVSAGAFDNFGPALPYASYIAARSRLITRLPFPTFVAIYTLAPLLCGALFAELISRSLSWRRTVAPIAFALAGLVVINGVIDQKRPLLLGVILIAVVIVLDPRCRARLHAMPGRPIRLAAIFGLGAYLLYLALLLIPLLSAGSRITAPVGTFAASSDFEVGLPGWSSAGPFIRPGAQLASGPGRVGRGMVVTTKGSMQGASYALGRVPTPRRLFSLSLSLRSPSGLPVNVFLGQRNDAVTAAFSPGNAWHTYALTWQPSKSVVDPTLALRFVGPGTFAVDDMLVLGKPLSAPRGLDRSGPLPAASPEERPTPATITRPVGSLSGVRLAASPEGRPTQATVTRPVGSLSGVRLAASPGGRPTQATVTRPVGSLTGVRFPALSSLGPRSRVSTVFFTALFGPLIRTAGPAIGYPVIFPAEVPYYPIDLGQDMFYKTRPHDDNVTSFAVLFPTAGPGSEAVSFMFVLYSQGGLLVALLGSLIIGFVWRTAWEISRRIPGGTTATLAQALVVLFGVQIALDGARNSVTAAYGVGWPLLFVIVIGLIGRLWARAATGPPTSAGGE